MFFLIHFTHIQPFYKRKPIVINANLEFITILFQKSSQFSVKFKSSKVKFKSKCQVNNNEIYSKCYTVILVCIRCHHPFLISKSV